MDLSCVIFDLHSLANHNLQKTGKGWGGGGKAGIQKDEEANHCN